MNKYKKKDEICTERVRKKPDMFLTVAKRILE